MKKIQLFLLMFVCVQINILAQKTINLNNENTNFRLSLKKAAAPAGIPQEYLKKAKAARFFALNPALQRAESVNIDDAVNLQLFENNSYAAHISKIVTDVNGTLTLSLQLIDYPMAFALIVTEKTGKSLVNVSIPELRQSFSTCCDIYSDVYYLIEIDEEKQIHQECKDTAPVPEEIMINAGEKTEGNALPPISLRADCSPNTNSGADDPAQIDLLIVYTTAAKNSVYALQKGGINNVIASMIALGNTSLSNSQTGITLNLVHSAEVAYSETNEMDVSLARLQSVSDGYMDDVHALRKQYGADLVQLVSTDAGGGYGYVLNNDKGSLGYGFSVVNVTQVGDTYPCSVHEFGHNLGLGHGAQHIINKSTGIFDYSYGWTWFGTETNPKGTKKYCSVMSYWSAENYSDNIKGYNVPYFSNPNVTHQEQPTGHEQIADAARSLRETKHVVAFYDNKLANQPDVPTNITVSNPTDHGATFSWEAADNVDTVRVCTPVSGNMYRYWWTTETSITISHSVSFSPCQTYNFFIMAGNACNDYVRSQTMTFNTACSATVTSVTVTPSSASVEKGQTQTFSAKINGTGNPEQTVTWDVENENSSSTNINSSGLLQVAANETASLLTVRATSKLNTAISGTATVKVTTPQPTTYTITAMAGDNGSIAPSGSITVEAGDNKTFTFSPNSGYQVDQVNVDNSNVSFSGNSYTFNNVQANHKINVTFKAIPPITYSLSLSSSNTSWGTVSGGGTYNAGTSVTATATPKNGYRFVR
ncbi:MAG: Ig-like domain-containing protein, partial [Tannerella sp.]|nr:Ig-like domain-containing protein [Tannerella sp.]